MPKAIIKDKYTKYGKIIIHNAIKYWIEPKRYGYEIKILDESEDVTNIECRMKKKYRPYDEETFRKR